MAIQRKRSGPFSLQNGRLDPLVFAELSAEYERMCGFGLVICDAEGNLLQGLPGCKKFPCLKSCRECRERVLAETQAAGYPCIDLCHEGFALLGVPIVQKEKVVGGVIVAGIDVKNGSAGPSAANRAEDLKNALTALRKLAAKYKISGKILRGSPSHHSRCLKDTPAVDFPVNSFHFDRMREAAFAVEHRLREAISRGERTAAHRSLEEMTAEIHACGAMRLDMVKGFATEIVVLMGQSAMLSGTEPHRLLSLIYESVTLVIQEPDINGITRRLTDTLDRVLQVASGPGRTTQGNLLAKALTFIEKNLERDISRDDVARAAGLSTSNFSRLIKERTGRTFVDMLNQYRVDRTSQLLIRTDRNLAEIASQVGFSDQSYLSKIFRKYTGLTPSDYRQKFRRVR